MINHFCFAKFLEWYQNKNFKTFVNQIGNLTFVQRTPKSKPFLMCCASCCCCCCCFVVGGGGGGKFCFVGICYRTNVVWLQNSTVLISIYSKIYLKVRENLQETCRRLLHDIPNIRIGLMAHGDYCDHHTYVIRQVDLTSDVQQLVDFANDTPSTSGGDSPEVIWSPLIVKIYQQSLQIFITNQLNLDCILDLKLAQGSWKTKILLIH